MVSIHIVPVIVYLIIRVISCIFRFKCEINTFDCHRNQYLLCSCRGHSRLVSHRPYFKPACIICNSRAKRKTYYPDDR